MSLSIPTEIRQHLQANDAVQEPIDFEEIIFRLEEDKGLWGNHGVNLTKDRKEQREVATNVGPSVAVPSAATRRGILVAAAAAVVTLLLLGLIPLFSGGEAIPPAGTAPQPTTPSTAATQTTTSDTDPQPEGDATASMVFTAVPSDPIAVLGSLTWRTVELPAPGRLRVGLDGRIYLLTQDVVWISNDGVDWTGYPAEEPLGETTWSAVGQDRLITAGGGGWFGDAQGPIEPRPVTVTIWDLSDSSVEVTRIAQSLLPSLDGETPDSVAMGSQAAVVSTGTSVFYSESGDQWIPIDALQATNSPGVNYIGVMATSDGFYAIAGITVFFSTDGIEWTQVHETRFPILLMGRWGDSAIADDGETIWRLPPQGGEVLYTGDDRSRTRGWGWGSGLAGSPLGIMSVQVDSGRYLYSRDGVDWEDMPLPEGWVVTNVFVEEPIAMNGEVILVVASTSDSQTGGVFDGNRVLMATP